jgi:hypothetical protein
MLHKITEIDGKREITDDPFSVISGLIASLSAQKVSQD